MSYGGFQRGGQRRWQSMAEGEALIHIDALRREVEAGGSMHSYAKRTGVQKNALAEAVHTLVPGEVATLIQTNAGLESRKKGTSFESALRGMMRTRGYYSIRSFGSKSPIDMLCVGKGKPNLMIQAKRKGGLFFTEWNALWEIAEEHGCVPVLAQRGENDKGAVFFRLAGPKLKKGIRNDGMLIPFDPKYPDQDSLLAPALAATA